MVEIDINKISEKTIRNFLLKFDPIGKDNCWEWKAHRDIGNYGKFSFSVDHVRYKVAAHRFSVAYFKGPLPSDKIVMHKCDNPPCVNPNHLKIGTHVDNEQDKIRKGRKPRPKLIKHPIENAKKVFDLVLQDKMYSDICEELSLPGSIVTYIYQGIRHENNNYNDVFKTYSEEEQEIIKYKVMSRGERIPTSKLKEKDVKEIRIKYIFGEKIVNITKEYPVGVRQISNIVHKKHWGHVMDPDCYRQSVCDIYGFSFSCPVDCNGYLY